MKPTKIFVKPARPGMKLAHPVSGWLPDKGRRWIDDSFTRRRIADGGIVVAEPDAPQAEVDEDAPVPSATAPVPLSQTVSEK